MLKFSSLNWSLRRIAMRAGGLHYRLFSILLVSTTLTIIRHSIFSNVCWVFGEHTNSGRKQYMCIFFITMHVLCVVRVRPFPSEFLLLLCFMQHISKIGLQWYQQMFLRMRSLINTHLLYYAYGGHVFFFFVSCIAVMRMHACVRGPQTNYKQSTKLLLVFFSLEHIYDDINLSISLDTN